MPAKIAPDQSRGYLIPVGATVRGTGETGIFKRLMAMLRQRSRVVLITATTTDDPMVDDLDSRLITNGAGEVQRIALTHRSDTERQTALGAVEHADCILLYADQPLRLSAMLGGGAHGPSPRMGNVTLAPGLGLTNRLVIDQGGAGADRLGRLLGALALNPFALGIGLDPDTAGFVGPDNVMEVVGHGSITVVDPSDVGHSNVADAGPSEPISITNLRVHVLVHGSRYDLDFRRPL